MKTDSWVLEVLAELEQLGYDLKNDPLNSLEKAAELEYFRESVWFHDWPEGYTPSNENDSDKLIFQTERYQQALADLAEAKVNIMSADEIKATREIAIKKLNNNYIEALSPEELFNIGFVQGREHTLKELCNDKKED
jgi:hypothetical protein